MAEPYCLAMVLCDNVHIDSATGKQTILGTFSTVAAESFPTHLRLCVYFAITDAEGAFELTLRIVDSKHSFDDDSQPILELHMNSHSPNPLAVIEGALGGIVGIPEPGVYHCELLAGGNVLMSRRLVALRRSDFEG